MSSLTIPEKCGVILLPDTVLFPHGAMPLHIFEPRYRNMLEEALEGDCLFCVGNLMGQESDGLKHAAAKIGTIGLIRASRESQEGTSNLLLYGVFRVHFDEWLDEKPYPYAAISPMLSTTLSSSEIPESICVLRTCVNRALLKFPDTVSKRINDILNHVGDLTIMVDTVTQQFIHDPSDRQKLLEMSEVRQRLDFIIHFLENAA